MVNKVNSLNLCGRIFNKLLIIARPAAGKSEIIDYLINLQEEKRREKFHIGKIHVIDDFPFLWRWFEEDDLLSKMDKPRLFTDDEGYFKENYFWHLLIKMMNLEFEKFLRDAENHEEYTVILEFSRGKEHGGYCEALKKISSIIIDNLPIMYVEVSWNESLRKNRERFNPKKPDSILEHALPDKKLKNLYHECDFRELTQESGSNEFIRINGSKLPYVIFQNEDDVTTNSDNKLADRLKEDLDILWQRTINVYQV